MIYSRPKENNHIRICVLSLSHSQTQQEDTIIMSSSIWEEAQQKDTIAQIETFA
jgi:hypothetical protein